VRPESSLHLDGPTDPSGDEPNETAAKKTGIDGSHEGRRDGDQNRQPHDQSDQTAFDEYRGVHGPLTHE
jgi:hypothetical protein